VLGRFLQADPSGFGGGFNLYAYAGNDPVNLTDSTGQSPDGGGLTITLSESVATPFMAVDGGPSSMIVSVTANTMTKCTGCGRGLAGNTRLVGRQGGIPGQTIQLGTAAVIPQQFGVSSGTALGPYASSIHGTIGNASFSGITDVMGGKSPIPGVNVRTAMQQLFPGQLILEIPGATDQGANAAVTIFVPYGLKCPTGTSAAGGN
jgi:hypothetical protein